MKYIRGLNYLIINAFCLCLLNWTIKSNNPEINIIQYDFFSFFYPNSIV